MYLAHHLLDWLSCALSNRNSLTVCFPFHKSQKLFHFYFLRSGVLVSPYLNEPNDVTPKSFVYHYNELTANKNEKLLKEYKTIESILPAGNMIHNAAKQNTSKNRYSNIMPFDFNRVILSTADGDTDYINASYIDVRMRATIFGKLTNLSMF